MCGLAGAILGKKRRRRDELRIIAGIFTELLVLNEKRGWDAAGVAVVRSDGSLKLFKRPGRATELVENKLYHCVLALNNKVTAVLGHTRRKTRGSECRNVNNHPIRAGRVIGTHNGHIANADFLVKELRLPRVAEVDSEVLFRLADRARSNVEFKRLLALCRGRITAAFVRLNEPLKVHLLKGDMPLALAYVPRFRTFFYASEEWMLGVALEGQQYQMLELAPFTFSTCDICGAPDFYQHDVTFLSPGL